MVKWSQQELEALAQSQRTGERRLWASIIIRALRWNQRYFVDPGSTFPLAAQALGWDPGAFRERLLKKRRPRMPQEPRSPKGEDDTTAV